MREDTVIKKQYLITITLLIGLASLPTVNALANESRIIVETGTKTSISMRKVNMVINESKKETVLDIEMPETTKEPIKEPELKETKLDNKKFWVKQGLNLRTGAGVGYSKILTIPTAKEVNALAQISNGWYKVEYSGKTGYVSGKYLSEKKIEIPIKAPAENQFKPLTIHFPGKIVPFKNGGKANGQSIIDRNYSMASTWGGAEVFSGDDGKNTHIVAHNPGAFTGIWKYSMGTKIIIVDHDGIKTTYAITDRFITDDNGNRIDGGGNMYSYITSTRGGEVVTFQTCKNSAENWIIRAEKVN